MIVWVKSERKINGRYLLAGNARIVKSFFGRLLGLMFRKTFGGTDGLVLGGCTSIHTFFMRFPIDVVFIDRERRVTALGEGLKPWRFFVPGAKSVAVIELPAGTVGRQGVAVGDSVVFLA